MKKIAILGVGPGLGMSMAHRFGREGFTTALVSRTDVRHAGYRAALAEAGIEATTHVADVAEPERVLAEIGEADVVYYGPAATTVDLVPLPDASVAQVTGMLDSTVGPAVAVARAVLPGMLARGDGALLFAGGLSGKYTMPMLGTLAPASAALRSYVLTLAAALADSGVYAATLTIGGLIERGDIHRMMGDGIPTLDPDAIADTAWQLYVSRDRNEEEFITPGLLQSTP
ncbi:MAG: SDR family NAD(P)-dependent oxidoreductase [Nonomuraea sp.]|nr:SDR family NAD(P)-dependent oxidoreductase [Nonomuraea sp.]